MDLTFLYMWIALALDSLTNRSTKYPSSRSVTLSRWSISCLAKPCRLKAHGSCGGEDRRVLSLSERQAMQGTSVE